LISSDFPSLPAGNQGPSLIDNPVSHTGDDSNDDQLDDQSNDQLDDQSDD
jgi:hypothetical protein